ncbi:hypothetical protein [Bordetella sp. 2513F-2]
MRAEDILPDRQDHAELKGVIVRKGTVGAFLANARIWCEPGVDAARRQAAERDILDALPALRALGLFDVLSIRNPALRRLVDAH